MRVLKGNSILFFILLILLLSCSKERQIPPLEQNNFVITITTDNIDGYTSYLYNASSNPVKIDSAVIENNRLLFKGKVEYPLRHIVTIDSIYGSKLFILENDSINIQTINNNLIDAIITGSELNEALETVIKKSTIIYDQIDLLFPDLQRARLENDVKELNRISVKMNAIEQENINFNFEYAKQHNDSFISAMILNDLSKRDSIDVYRISEVYNSLSAKVKKSADSKEVESFLASQH